MSTTDESSSKASPSDQDSAGLTITVSGGPNEVVPEIRRAARRTLRSERCPGGRLDIIVVGDASMRRYNARWLGRDATTDVLAFDLRDAPGDGRVDGQIAVCISVARRRARARGTDWRGELALYVVHGCLHLCGYDDQCPEGAAAMHGREDQILTALGWGPVFSQSPARPSAKPKGGRRVATRPVRVASRRGGRS